MRTRLLLIALAITVYQPLVNAQEKTYTADWKSLDSRPVADWFSDAKFGIFIHWGPYSVPSWSPKGTYEEWYQTWFQSESVFGNGKFTGQEIPDFHKSTYGADFNYIDFAKLWKAELYNPVKWAEIFKKSGAKYVVMTSKHHDGFALWPNEHATKSRGHLWNSVVTGPKRDLVGDFVTAMKDAGLKAGLYYSLYEWYHPWYQAGLDKFVTDYYHPQFKDLVDNYEPDLIYADGEWEKDDSYWRSKELLAWLFNDSKVKDDVVINDRWVKGQRHKHGGFYTTEYLREEVNFDKPWEEIRGMGLSFGYNRNEDIEDYNSPQMLILMLSDIVSQGGNLCINVGPAADGKIPVIMQERLLQIGKWLATNGDAIYGTKKWKRSYQWSPGDRNFQLLEEGQSYVEGDYILKQTVWQQPGKAVKELFFTKKDNDVYAISPKWPGKELVIKDVKLKTDTKITLLATGENLAYQKQGKDVIVTLPEFNPNNFQPEDYYAFVFKISQVN
ncbi:alpha-L-fucosidase [Muricauda sp. 2012CJ35-5]|uniref:alpha-L-fucosidase n=1 Tax=Flagellimonas spongiicola TaxID=2942208 RepID=A0ABT0PU55_9FLAO|nr:alpha-L-fucosidase [Allomuricauda spongiicola]MCL6274922.1 alpha-L-fucosidase [Allomuricauda spongiicola]